MASEPAAPPCPEQGSAPPESGPARIGRPGTGSIAAPRPEQGSAPPESGPARTGRPGTGSIAAPPYLCPINTDSLSADDLRGRLGERDLYIWGGAFVGQGVWNALTRHGFSPRAFLDSSPRFRQKTLRGLPVLPPEPVLRRGPEEIFVITASGHWEDELMDSCRAAGLRESRDFVSFNDLAPIQPAIEISGVCNLRCQGCPRGNMAEKPPAGFMNAETYRLVLDKLLREIPFLGGVQLYTWGEPLLNRDLLQIMEYNRGRGVLSIVSTNLNVEMDMAVFAAGRPDLVRLSSSGWGDNYERTHTGGRWELFLGNFQDLAQARRDLCPEMEVELYYHLYRHNQGEDYRRMKALTEEAGFVFRPVWGCLYPWDNLMRFFQGPPLTETAARHQELLIGDLNQIIREARNGPERPCTQVRCFPINWDLSVLGCGGWYLPRLPLADNFLRTPLTEVVRAKMTGPLCRECAARAIHRVNFPFMADRAGEAGRFFSRETL